MLNVAVKGVLPQGCRLRPVDALGRVVVKRKMSRGNGVWQERILLSGMRAGAYFLALLDGNDDVMKAEAVLAK